MGDGAVQQGCRSPPGHRGQAQPGGAYSVLPGLTAKTMAAERATCGELSWLIFCLQTRQGSATPFGLAGGGGRCQTPSAVDAGAGLEERKEIFSRWRWKKSPAWWSCPSKGTRGKARSLSLTVERLWEPVGARDGPEQVQAAGQLDVLPSAC